VEKLNNFYEEYDEYDFIDDADIQSDKYLTFFVDDQLFGISISQVVQISGMQEVTEVPEFPKYVKGVISFRDTIIPLIDVRIRLKKEEIVSERQCIIITHIDGTYMGFIVDSVNEVTDIPHENITDPPQVGSDGGNSYINGIARLNDKIIILIDLNKILNEKEIDFITGGYDEEEQVEGQEEEQEEEHENEW